MNNIITYLAILFCAVSIAQVGIGTVSPDASSVVDISAPDKGMLIPRVSLNDVTNTMLDGTNTAATGLLIWNTNASVTGGSGVGYYYFNGTTWERLVTTATAGDDIDWYEEGTTTAPDDINDDMYTLGNVGIGTISALYRLQLAQTDNTATRTLSMNSLNATSGTSFTFYNESTYTGSGDLRNLYNLVGGGATGNITGVYNNIQNSGNGIHFGTNNLLAGSGSGAHYGLYNSLSGSGSGAQNGVYNLFQNNGGNQHTGLYNNFNGDGTTQKGVYNDFSNGLAITNFGLHNNFASDNIAGTTDYGVYNEIGGNSASPMYGVYNLINNSGIGAHYGLYNSLTNGNGELYGMYSEIVANNSGSPQYGVYSLLSGTGTNTEQIGNYNVFGGETATVKGLVNDFANVSTLGIRGIENNITYSGLAQNSTNIAVYNELDNTSVGDQYGIYQIFGDGGGTMYGLYNQMATGNASFTGTTNIITSTGPGDKYGTDTFIDPAAGGTHYGIFSNVLKTGSYAGYFLGNVSIGTSTLNTYSLPASRGSADQVIQTDGSGNLSWVDPSALTGNLWNTAGNSGTDGGTNDFVGTTDAVPLMLKTNNVDRVRITTTGQIEQLNTNNSVFVGENSGSASTGLGNVHVGFNAGAAGTTGQYNTYIGYEAGRLMTTLSNNTFVGSFAGYNTDTGANNTFIGSGAGASTTSGSSNTIIGVSAGQLNDQGGQNIIIGRGTGLYNYDGNRNIYLGYEAGFGNLDATASAAYSNNIFIGYQSGYNVAGNNNVFLGYQAGLNEIGSNKLYIENSSSLSPLIYGDFNLDLLQINGSLNINNQYTLPLNDGAANQILQTNGGGALSWQDATAVVPVVNANNGLTLNATNVQLGGTLLSDTRVSANTSQMIFNLNSSGDFTIEDNLTPIFRVLDTGATLIGDDMFWRDINVLGTDLMVFTDDGDDGRLRIMENGITSIDFDANTQVVFNEQGLDRNFRIESSPSANQFFVDAGSGRVGINTGTPSTAFHVNHPLGTANGLSISNATDADRWHMYTFTTNDLHLYFNNNNRGSFDDVSGTYTPVSDRNLKRNIADLGSTLEKVKQLRPVDYNFKDQKDSKKYVGFIAQEVEQVYPELVQKSEQNGDEYTPYRLDYSGFAPVAIKAIQEQQKIIESQQQQIDALKNEMEQIKQLLRDK